LTLLGEPAGAQLPVRFDVWSVHYEPGVAALNRITELEIPNDEKTHHS
jgi:hypothetical protein